MKNESITQLLYCSSTVLCTAKTQWDTNLISKYLLGKAGKKKTKRKKRNSTEKVSDLVMSQDCGRGFE